jgi:hypothetical protein
VSKAGVLRTSRKNGYMPPEGLDSHKGLVVVEPCGLEMDYGLELVEGLKQKDIKQFVAEYHRHHKPPLGDKYRVAVRNGRYGIIGVAMLGRPVSRHLDNGETLEVNRVAVNNGLPYSITQNVCSMLYSRCCRWAMDQGYTTVITYTLEDEDSASVRASGFILDGVTKGGSWNCKSRPRTDKAPTCPKKRWIRKLNKEETK